MKTTEAHHKNTTFITALSQSPQRSLWLSAKVSSGSPTLLVPLSPDVAPNVQCAVSAFLPGARPYFSIFFFCFAPTRNSSRDCAESLNRGDVWSPSGCRHHPSIVVWNACNECSGTGLYASFVMTTVAQEDDSRPIWPSCPSGGWATGVHALDSRPNGNPLTRSLVSPTLRGGLGGIEQHGPYVFLAWA